MPRHLKGLFASKKKQEHRFRGEQYNQHHESKEQGLEKLLGEMYHLVGHATIPFQVGGMLDMYYFPNALDGTGFVTMELIEPDGSGSKRSAIGTYELIAFTRYRIGDQSDKEKFEEIERRMDAIFTTLAKYSYEAELKPLETVEVPIDGEKSYRYVILDEYKKRNASFMIGNKKYGLLLVIEVFRTEMEYAMKHGSSSMLNKLKEKGYYPYSDLDREALV